MIIASADVAGTLAEAWQAFIGQNNFIEFGKAPYVPGENGGIHGHVIYASTHEGGEACPMPPDRSRGYVWAVYPTFDIYLATDTGKIIKKLTDTTGYDAEGTVNFKDRKSVV